MLIFYILLFKYCISNYNFITKKLCTGNHNIFNNSYSLINNEDLFLNIIHSNKINLILLSQSNCKACCKIHNIVINSLNNNKLLLIDYINNTWIKKYLKIERFPLLFIVHNNKFYTFKYFYSINNLQLFYYKFNLKTKKKNTIRNIIFIVNDYTYIHIINYIIDYYLDNIYYTFKVKYKDNIVEGLYLYDNKNTLIDKLLLSDIDDEKITDTIINFMPKGFNEISPQDFNNNNINRLYILCINSLIINKKINQIEKILKNEAFNNKYISIKWSDCFFNKNKLKYLNLSETTKLPVLVYYSNNQNNVLKRNQLSVLNIVYFINNKLDKIIDNSYVKAIANKYKNLYYFSSEADIKFKYYITISGLKSKTIPNDILKINHLDKVLKENHKKYKIIILNKKAKNIKININKNKYSKIIYLNNIQTVNYLLKKISKFINLHYNEYSHVLKKDKNKYFDGLYNKKYNITYDYFLEL